MSEVEKARKRMEELKEKSGKSPPTARISPENVDLLIDSGLWIGNASQVVDMLIPVAVEAMNGKNKNGGEVKRK